MRIYTGTLMAVGMAALVAGCTTGSGGTTVVDSPYTLLQAKAEAAAAGIIDLDTGALLDDERTDVPTSGSASYEGYVGGEVGGDGVLIGELSMTVDFAAATATGSATNFQHETDGAYTGTLTLDNDAVLFGATPGDADLLAGDLEGTLTNGGTPYVTSIGLDGSFVGGTGAANPDAIAGGAVGTVGAETFDGLFVVNED